MNANKLDWPKNISRRQLFLYLVSISLFTLALLAWLAASKKTIKYVAYVGRYQAHEFDRLHEITLRSYLAELNTSLNSYQLELKVFDNKDDYRTGQAIYHQIAKDASIVVVVDNTWGKNLQPLANTIREEGIPVIAINADKQAADFDNNVVFVGHDDNVPADVVAFAKKILAASKILFVTEEDYALTTKFDREFGRHGLETTRFSVASDVVTPAEQLRLFDQLGEALRARTDSEERPVLVINTHRDWGIEIINFIDNEFEKIDIVGGPYITSSSKAGQFGYNDNKNRLLLLTAPSDAVLNKVYEDLRRFQEDHPEYFMGRLNSPLFIKRCLDAIGILRGAIYDERQLAFLSEIGRQTFRDHFGKLASNTTVGPYDLYQFDRELTLIKEISFEQHSGGAVSSFPSQLNSKRDVIPNILFGMEILNISEIDIEKRSYHADFYYWIKYDSRHGDAENFFHFRNIKNEDRREIATGELDSRVYRLYKVSADFNMGADLRDYPFDTQELRIELEISNPSDNVRISFDYESFRRSKEKSKEFDVGGWLVEDYYVTVDNLIAKSHRGKIDENGGAAEKFKNLSVRLQLRRKWVNPFVTIVLPLAMIGLAAILLIYVKDMSFANIGEVSVGIFLSIITYSIAFAQLTPKTNVLTKADGLFYITFGAVLLVFLTIILVNSTIISDERSSWLKRRAKILAHAALIAFFSSVALVVFV